MSYKVTIPKKHYLGMNVQGKNEVPLGFITPWTHLQTDAEKPDGQTRKRMSTVDGWCGSNSRYNNKTALKTHVIDNVPLSGFKTAKSFKRGGSWGAASAVWRIEDPRGFELEISNGNMVEIMLCTTVVEGEIYAPCVWGRCGQDNVLIPIDSDEYVVAKENTELVIENVSMKDVNVGNKIALQNGKIGTYLGSWYTLQRGDCYSDKTNDIGWASGKKHFLMVDNYDGYRADKNKSYIFCSSSFKVSKILSKETEELAVIQEIISNGMVVNKIELIDGHDAVLRSIVGISQTKVDIVFELDSISESFIKKQQDRNYHDTSEPFLIVTNSKMSTASMLNYQNYRQGFYQDSYRRTSRDDTKYRGMPFDVNKFLNDHKYIANDANDRYGRNNNYHETYHKDDSNNEFYLVKLTYKDDKTGNEYSPYLV